MNEGEKTNPNHYAGGEKKGRKRKVHFFFARRSAHVIMHHAGTLKKSEGLKGKNPATSNNVKRERREEGVGICYRFRKGKGLLGG